MATVALNRETLVAELIRRRELDKKLTAFARFERVLEWAELYARDVGGHWRYIDIPGYPRWWQHYCDMRRLPLSAAVVERGSNRCACCGSIRTFEPS